MSHQTILILDFGSQFTQLIARRLRELSVYCEILPFHTPPETLAARKPVGIILSGGPKSVSEDGAPKCDVDVLTLGMPVLGICYGMQLMTDLLGGRVAPASHREFGHATVHVTNPSARLLGDLPHDLRVWASHGDYVEAAPPAWTPAAVIEEQVERIRAQVGSERVLCGLSGGVDSAVAAALVHRAVGDQLTCVLVDHGLLRKNEAEQVVETFRDRGMKLIHVDATDRFLARLEGATEPEEKRKIIGEEFIRVFEAEAEKLPDVRFLVQGTLYSDVIESGGDGRSGAEVIKSHHNVGGLPEDLDLDLVEPLRMLFKDEVRAVGTELGLPDRIVWRQPFPGPGLGIRIVGGEVTRERLEILRNADVILQEEVRAAGLYRELWQSFCVLPVVRSVGVQGDGRSYAYPIVIRAVTSDDAMTADWARLPYDLLERVSNRIINEVSGVNRVALDVSSKPPATIEWE